MIGELKHQKEKIFGMSEVEFSVVTPSFNMLSYLKRCRASIADQGISPIEHIVMDAVSTDGTVKWLEQTDEIVSVVQKDKGMYDAINKGWARSSGKFISYLNCDEQYLPGTLDFVSSFFAKNDGVDVLFGDVLIVDAAGDLLAFRKGYKPRWPYIATSHLYVLSCTMFLRRRVFDSGLVFDINYKDIGDYDFVIRLLRAGFKSVHVKRYLSVFTMTGKNMSQGENAMRERIQTWNGLPIWLKIFKHPLNAARLLEKMMSGAYFQKTPLNYALYTSTDLTERTQFQADKIPNSWKWPE